MSLPLSLIVKHEGRSVQLTLERCKVFMAGELAGNVTLSLGCDPGLEPIIRESLHLQNPGKETSEEFVAFGDPGDGVVLTFYSEAIAHLEDVPESLVLLWCGEAIATIAPELGDLVPIDKAQTLIDPLSILGQTNMQSENPFCLGVEREFMRLIPVFLVGAFGLVWSFAEGGMSKSLLPYVNLAGGLLVFCSAVIAVYGVWMPRRQVWFDRNRREILIVESRTLRAEKKLTDAARYSVDGFAHVRVCGREYAPELSSDNDDIRTDYLVSLEGPIGFASDDGRAHGRSDALHLARFSGISGQRAARRFAAKVGLHAGLKILIASDW